MVFDPGFPMVPQMLVIDERPGAADETAGPGDHTRGIRGCLGAEIHRDVIFSADGRSICETILFINHS